MNKIAIITDQHFGARNDSLIFLDFYEKFYKNVFFPKLDEENIRTVLILGDTFDRRKYINFYSISRAKEMFFNELDKRGLNVKILVGNHDIFFKNTNSVNSPDLLLREYPFDIIETPTTISVNDTEICMIPWICPDIEIQSFEEMKKSKAEICMGHFEIAGFSMYRGMEAHEGLSPKIFDKFDMVFSGHYHHRSNMGSIHYLGNPYELTWQDYDDKRGFHLFDLETRKLEFIPNDYSIFHRLEYDDTRELVELGSLDLKDMFVKLIVVNKTNPIKFDNFLQKLYNKGCYEIKIVEDLSEFKDGDIGEEINLEDTSTILSNYIKSIDTELDKVSIENYMKVLHLDALNQEVV